MPSPFIDSDGDVLTYPTPPPRRVPGFVAFLLWFIALAATSNIGQFAGSYLYQQSELATWQAVLVGWVLGIAVGTTLFSGVAWARAPRGGWWVAFKLPLVIRVFLRVVVYLGVPALSFVSFLVLPPELESDLFVLVFIGGLVVTLVIGAPLVERASRPVDGAEPMWDRFRPRGAVRRDVLTPEQVAEVTGRSVQEVIRLDADHPKIWSLSRLYHGLRVRYVLDDESTVEVTHLYLSGTVHGNSSMRSQMRELGITPQKRIKKLGKSHRLDPITSLGEEAYACTPNDGGTEWLLIRLREFEVLELRTSAGYGRFTRLSLAEAALAADAAAAESE
ncbi:hypothetical protein [Glycomyces buryatensis]|uniref:Uncharacterized protein n=1 Tax=Glycomyces buryatensis TaxID=2570927 RepID=A0A4S8Q3M2_9ACTN|nr:hypothetical protein [Glycomyces buryatensis]THV37152.1 hypothetical protein FAB82_20510 [Glycomyces buryatensis]